MMLSASPFYQHSSYMPARPSPLSERPPNVPAFSLHFAMASQPQEGSKGQPQRKHKANPVVQTRDAATQRRRDLFFRRVQKERDDKKWAARGEQIQRLDWVSDQKRWEAEKARQAPELKDDYIESLAEETAQAASACDTQASNTQQSREHMTEEEYILAQEEYELQALVAALEEEQNNQENTGQHYGSDDDDYDQIFMDCMTAETAPGLSANTGVGGCDPDAMDMTDG